MSTSAPARYPWFELAATRPELRYAYRGLVPGRGSHGTFSPAWFSCWLVEQGTATVLFTDGRRIQAEEGQWLLCPPYVARDQFFPAGASIISVAFHLPLPPGCDPTRALPLVVTEAEAVAALQEPAVAMLSVLNDSAAPDRGDRRVLAELDLGSWLAAQRHLAAFVAVWFGLWGDATATPASVARPLDARVRTARTLIGADARMAAVPYARIQERTGLSRVHLDRLFASELGHSPKEELDRRLLERVLRRIADPHRPLKAIAHELGFADSSHLCRWFRRRTGQSPERHRRLITA